MFVYTMKVCDFYKKNPCNKLQVDSIFSYSLFLNLLTGRMGQNY